MMTVMDNIDNIGTCITGTHISIFVCMHVGFIYDSIQFDSDFNLFKIFWQFFWCLTDFFSLPFSLIYYRINKQNKRLSIVQCSIHWIWFGPIVFFVFPIMITMMMKWFIGHKICTKKLRFFLFVLIYLFIVFNVYVFTIILKSSSWYLWMEQRKKNDFFRLLFITNKQWIILI